MTNIIERTISPKTLILLKYAKSFKSLENVSWQKVSAELMPIYNFNMGMSDLIKTMVNSLLELSSSPHPFEVKPIHDAVMDLILSPVTGVYRVTEIHYGSNMTYSVEEYYNSAIKHMLSVFMLARVDFIPAEEWNSNWR